MSAKNERKARELYGRNKRHVEENPNLPWRELSMIAKQQDRLYLYVHGHRSRRGRKE